nr:hypothetical protein Iba_chr04cCG14930 [Ipomoea batatas]
MHAHVGQCTRLAKECSKPPLIVPQLRKLDKLPCQPSASLLSSELLELEESEESPELSCLVTSAVGGVGLPKGSSLSSSAFRPRGLGSLAHLESVSMNGASGASDASGATGVRTWVSSVSDSFNSSMRRVEVGTALKGSRLRPASSPSESSSIQVELEYELS